jgi:formylglycine-generating enzyme required for sulfatase activity
MMYETPSLPSASRTWRDRPEAPLMVELSADEFVMGENPGDRFANDTERPAHVVRIRHCFALGRTPVTVGEYRHFNPAQASEEDDQLPVVRVSWRDAAGYCDWLSDQAGRAYRLPSEAEWEYACRAGVRTPFASGDDLPPALANYLYDESGIRVGLGRRTPVGSYPANAFGLYDLHGNVCEWVADDWHPDYLGAPADGRPWNDSSGIIRRVIRGGAWDYLPRLLRSAWRDRRPADFRADNIGFRVVTDDLKQPVH